MIAGCLDPGRATTGFDKKLYERPLKFFDDSFFRFFRETGNCNQNTAVDVFRIIPALSPATGFR